MKLCYYHTIDIVEIPASGTVISLCTHWITCLQQYTRFSGSSHECRTRIQCGTKFRTLYKRYRGYYFGICVCIIALNTWLFVVLYNNSCLRWPYSCCSNKKPNQNGKHALYLSYEIRCYPIRLNHNLQSYYHILFVFWCLRLNVCYAGNLSQSTILLQSYILQHRPVNS